VRRAERPSLGGTPGLSWAAKAGHDNAMLQAASLAALPGIRHAFFTRDGGVSDGIYASLNGGPGSGDAPAKVAENRARMAAALGVDRLLTAYQIHSPDVVTIERPWDPQERPRADGLVTRTPEIAIGVTTADCGPVLLADAAAGVIGAAHAGWKPPSRPWNGAAPTVRAWWRRSGR
jgi:polyphenol oxidase